MATIIVLSAAYSLHAQTADTTKPGIDTTSLFDLDMEMNIDLASGTPYAMAWGGQSMLNREGMQADIASVTSVGLSFGMEKTRKSAVAEGIRRFKRDGLYVWHGLAADTAGTTNATLGVSASKTSMPGAMPVRIRRRESISSAGQITDGPSLMLLVHQHCPTDSI
jgi:hypothetical protein